MFLLLILGVLTTTAAFPTEFLWSWVPKEKVGVVQSILTSFGVALISAGVLLVFEPRLRTAVRKSTESAVESATSTIRDDIMSDVKVDIESKFSTLQERIDSAISAGIADEDAMLAGFKGDLSYEYARETMESASESNAIYFNSLLVNATNDPNGLYFGLSLQADPQVQQSYDFGRTPLPIEEFDLYVVARVGCSTTWKRDVYWRPDEELSAPVEELLKKLEASGDWGRGKNVDWDGVHERLVHGLEAAIKSRRQEADSYHLAAPLTEYVEFEQQWFITETSVECPEIDWKHEFQDAPDHVLQLRLGRTPERPPLPSKPDQVGQDVWEYLLARMK